MLKKFIMGKSPVQSWSALVQALKSTTVDRWDLVNEIEVVSCVVCIVIIFWLEDMRLTSNEIRIYDFYMQDRVDDAENEYESPTIAIQSVLGKYILHVPGPLWLFV